ncbi:MAG: thioredoxin domain-containing protein, partial [Verrucomicrobia bacterium]
VDREERPDVDRVYMNFVQRLTGSGGWPLNVFLTPERKPFFGGTYFPPKSDPARRLPGFRDILQRIHQLWETDRENLLAQSDQMTRALNEFAATPPPDSDTAIDLNLTARTISALAATYDAEHGGFGGAPKFPTPINLSFLLRAGQIRDLPADLRRQARDMALSTLRNIVRSGLRDHLGGGFHRYAVDAAWNLPHFEKMLYDQALLLTACVEAWRVTHDPEFEAVIRQTVDYLLRDLRDAGGAFHSAEDAESFATAEADHKTEGAFYVWTLAQIRDVLADPEDIALAIRWYDLRPEGNAPEGPEPEAFAGRNILRQAVDLDTLAAELETTPAALSTRLERIRQRLFAARENRPRPFRDDKIIAGWNGLAISALSQAALALGEHAWAEAAGQAADFLRARLYEPETRTLRRLFRETPSTVEAFSEDYAFLIAGLLDLYEATGDIARVQWAADLQQTHIAHFHDGEHGGFYSEAASGNTIFTREKEAYDGVVPAPSSVAARNLARLGLLLDNAEFRAMAEQTVRAFLPLIEEQPDRMPALVDAIGFVIHKPVQLVVAADGAASPEAAILRPFAEALIPHAMLLHADSGAGQAFLARHLDFIEGMAPIDGKPTAYLCHNFVCQLPTADPAVLRTQLRALLPADE